jgi:hypothetical protein
MKVNLKNNAKANRRYGLSPYAAVCRFGRPDNGNYLESGESRVNMLTRRFAFVPPYIGRMNK